MRSKPNTPSGAITDAEVAAKVAEYKAEAQRQIDRDLRAKAVAELANERNVAVNTANKVAQAKANGHTFPHEVWPSCPIPVRGAYASPPSIGWPFVLKADGVHAQGRDHASGGIHTVRMVSPIWPVGKYVQGKGLPVAVLQADRKTWTVVLVPTDKLANASAVLEEAGAVFTSEGIGGQGVFGGVVQTGRAIPASSFLLRFLDFASRA